jgi:hypothetical protein
MHQNDDDIKLTRADIKEILQVTYGNHELSGPKMIKGHPHNDPNRLPTEVSFINNKLKHFLSGAFLVIIILFIGYKLYTQLEEGNLMGVFILGALEAALVYALIKGSQGTQSEDLLFTPGALIIGDNKQIPWDSIKYIFIQKHTTGYWSYYVHIVDDSEEIHTVDVTNLGHRDKKFSKYALQNEVSHYLYLYWRKERRSR